MYFHRHNADPNNPDNHLPLHAPFVIGHAIDSSIQHGQNGVGIFFTVTNLWLLLNVIRVINSGWALRIFADCTYSISRNAVALMGFAVNSMGGKHHFVAVSVIPNHGENAENYTRTWRSICDALFLVLKTYKNCRDPDCATCKAVMFAKHHEQTKKFAEAADYTADSPKLPVASAICDCHKGFQKFVRDIIGLEPDSCFSHMAGNVFLCSFSFRARK